MFYSPPVSRNSPALPRQRDVESEHGRHTRQLVKYSDFVHTNKSKYNDSTFKVSANPFVFNKLVGHMYSQ